MSRFALRSLVGVVALAGLGQATAAPIFTAGNLVVSLVGNVDGTRAHTDNQATPIALRELTTSGTVVGR